MRKTALIIGLVIITFSVFLINGCSSSNSKETTGIDTTKDTGNNNGNREPNTAIVKGLGNLKDPVLATFSRYAIEMCNLKYADGAGIVRVVSRDWTFDTRPFCEEHVVPTSHYYIETIETLWGTIPQEIINSGWGCVYEADDYYLNGDVILAFFSKNPSTERWQFGYIPPILLHQNASYYQPDEEYLNSVINAPKDLKEFISALNEISECSPDVMNWELINKGYQSTCKGIEDNIKNGATFDDWISPQEALEKCEDKNTAQSESETTEDGSGENSSGGTVEDAGQSTDDGEAAITPP